MTLFYLIKKGGGEYVLLTKNKRKEVKMGRRKRRVKRDKFCCRKKRK